MKKLLIITASLILVAVVAAYLASRGGASGKPSTAPYSSRKFGGFDALLMCWVSVFEFQRLRCPYS